MSGIYASRIRDFGFSCCNQRKAGERFVLVFTDADGSLEYVYCHRPTDKIVLCLSSALPWFSCFHGLLDIMWFNELYRSTRWHILHPWLARLVSTPPSQQPSNCFFCPDPFRANQHLKFRIPTSYAPHNPKYMMEYYSALELPKWIHIFVRLILERSVLFYSSRLTRLTACVLAAVSLLYPLQWVHSFYPLIPEKAIEVVGCPSPYIAGIHTCNLEAAMEHVSPGTCMVNLDSGKIHFPPSANSSYSPDPDSDTTLTPKAVFYFLRHQLKDIMRQVNSAFSDNNAKNHNWKRVDGDSCSFFEELSRPFFCLLLNLLGSYRRFVVGPDERRAVDVPGLIASQRCPDLEPFLHSFCDTQAVQLFFEIRSEQTADFTYDSFESASSLLTHYQQHYKGKNDKWSHSTGSTPSLAPLPLAEALNGIHRTNSALSYDSPLFVHTGHKQWIQAKKIRSPGELCAWDHDLIRPSWKFSHSMSVGSNLMNWTQKFRSQTTNLKKSPKSKVDLTTESSEFSANSRVVRSRGSRVYNTLRPLSVPQRSTEQYSSGTDSCQRLDTLKTNSLDARKSTLVNGSACAKAKYKPPRPPPPRLASEIALAKPDQARSISTEPSTLHRIGKEANSPPTLTDQQCSPDVQKTNPPPLPPRPAWVLLQTQRSHTLNHIMWPTTERGDFGSQPMHYFYRNSPISSSFVLRPRSNFGAVPVERLLSVSPLESTTPPFPSPLTDTFPPPPTSQLLLRRMNRWRTCSTPLESPGHRTECKPVQNERTHVQITRSGDTASSSFHCQAVGDIGGTLNSRPKSVTHSFSGDRRVPQKRCATFSNVHEVKKEPAEPRPEPQSLGRVATLSKSWNALAF